MPKFETLEVVFLLCLVIKQAHPEYITSFISAENSEVEKPKNFFAPSQDQKSGIPEDSSKDLDVSPKTLDDSSKIREYSPKMPENSPESSRDSSKSKDGSSSTNQDVISSSASEIPYMSKVPEEKLVVSPQSDIPSVSPSAVTPDVCSMSLKSSVDVDAEEKKCSCSVITLDVDCSHLDVTQLPPLISFPKGVRIASFQGNMIDSINMDTFYSGRDLTELDLSYNRIDFVSSRSFEALKSLRRLDLSHNKLWNIASNAFLGLNGLQRLDLSYNDLIMVFPEIFSHLFELRELSLEKNPLQQLEPKTFEYLTKLEKLDLSETLLKSIPDHLFVFTPNLKYLNLAGNQLNDVPTEAISVLDKLKVLHLSENSIETIPPEAFRGLSGLVMLYMDKMPYLTRIEKHAFGDMLHLQELHCSYNFLLSEIEGKAFVRKVTSQRVTVNQLFLRQNQLSTIPKDLQEWNDGMELHIRDNPLICDCRLDWINDVRLKNNFQLHAICTYPSELEGRSLSQLHGQRLHCGLHVSELVLISCSLVIALFIIALIVALLVWRRNYGPYRKPYFAVYKNAHVDVDYKLGDDDF